ncbi:MAG: hypothetical protein IKD95_05750 [Bacteroidales bacterium]|nr:hypothetical protein [Bacteroidales bacterium]
MKKHFLLYTTLILAAFAAASCKKDDEKTEIKPYLYGLDFDLATFARPDDTFTLTPYGVYTGDGKDIEKIAYKWKWKLNDGEYSEVSEENFTFTVKEIGNYTVACVASDPDEKYYSVTASKVIIVIDPTLGKTLNGTGISATDEHISDGRDAVGENEYYFTHIGDLDWFRNNLAYKGSGIAYEDSDVTSYPLGRYYTWDEAMTACPDGWRLPTDEEWALLGTDSGPLTCDAYLNSKRMWDFWPDVYRTNETGLAIIPAGYALPAITSPTYKRLYDYAAFWTATESAADSRMAAYRYIFVEENQVRSTYAEKGSLALSVRCVR